jgi:nucleotide-binding universal stress UspA family protein
MAYRDLLVVLDSEPRARQRLLLAADLAERFDAYVTVGLENSRRYHRSDTYAHSRVRELVLGGTTRTMLRSMTLPVLMAH